MGAFDADPVVLRSVVVPVGLHVGLTPTGGGGQGFLLRTLRLLSSGHSIPDLTPQRPPRLPLESKCASSFPTNKIVLYTNFTG